jgi:beta-N-acetylhexosaminidase
VVSPFARALACCAVLMACVSAACTVPSTPGAGSPYASTSSVEAASTRWADSVVRGLSLRDRAAQMVWPSVTGDYVTTDDPRWLGIMAQIRNEHVGGFTVSVGSPFDIANKLAAMQAKASVPLLFGADFEAGAGFRARGGVFLPNVIELGGATWTPPLMAVGATGDTALAYRLGEITAMEGRALGVHIVYGPVLDVNNNPGNPVINVRSFGEDPALVARLGAAFVRGVQRNGMVATGKHFPGHGDTDVNSHLALPVVTAGRARLDSVELVPFRAAINAGLGAMMTFHGAMPALDSSGIPATLSPAILGGLLRGELHFAGLAISDAMDMRGVLDQFGAEEAARRAVAAGADVLIQPEDVGVTIDAIVDGVKSGRYPESRVTDAARRILALKARVGAGATHADAEHIRRTVGTAAHRAFADTVARRSMTLVRDAQGVVPMRTGSRVLSVTVARRSDLLAGGHFDATLRSLGFSVRSVYVDADQPGGGDFTAATAAADSTDVVVVGSHVATRWDAATIQQSAGFVRFVSRTGLGRKPLMVVAFGNPYLLQQVADTPGYLVAWSGGSPAQSAAARALAGQAALTGTLPISIPPMAARGAGIQRTAVAR